MSCPRRSLLAAALALFSLMLVAGPAFAATTATTHSAVPETTSALLRGNVLDDDGSGTGSVTYHFEYGLSDAYGTSTPSHTTPYSAGAEKQETVSGLSPSTTYHYRVVVTEPDGTTVKVAGADEAFTTKAPPPPDRDNDGKPDSSDNCPDVAAPGTADGCPDRDSDGVPDASDGCPDAAYSTSDGCPPHGNYTSSGAPTAVTLDNTDIAADTYTMHAIVNPHGQSVSYEFQWSYYADFRRYQGSQTVGGQCYENKPVSDGRGGFVGGGPGGIAGANAEGYPDHSDHFVSCRPATPDEGAFLTPGAPTIHVRIAVSQVQECSPTANSYPQCTILPAPRFTFGEDRPVGAGEPPAPSPFEDGDGDTQGEEYNPEIASENVAEALLPYGKAARIGAILKAGAYPARFYAPRPGKQQIAWYFVPKGARVAAKKKPVLIASGSKVATKAGAVVVKVKLSKKGKRALRKAKRLKLTAKGTFTPDEGEKLTLKVPITLKR